MCGRGIGARDDSQGIKRDNILSSYTIKYLIVRRFKNPSTNLKKLKLERLTIPSPVISVCKDELKTLDMYAIIIVGLGKQDCKESYL